MTALRSAILPLRSHSILQQAVVAGPSIAPVSRRHFSQSRRTHQESDTSPLDLAGQAVEASSSSPSTFSTFLSSASDAFLALPDHLPFHPSYATSIVLLTLALRCSITLPLTVWQRKRVKRVQEEVIPRVKSYMEEAKYELRAQFRRAGKDYTDYTKELNKLASPFFSRTNVLLTGLSRPKRSSRSYPQSTDVPRYLRYWYRQQSIFPSSSPRHLCFASHVNDRWRPWTRKQGRSPN